MPGDAPPLVLAVPGTAATAEAVAAEFAALTQAAHQGLKVRLAYQDELPRVLADVAANAPADDVAAVIAPLTTGPLPTFDMLLRAAVAGTRAIIAQAEPLGPHPLIAQALHARLAEAGLARADRVRLMTTHSPTDGVVVCVVGGDDAIRHAEVSCVLLASRLAVPVVAVALDAQEGPGAVARAVERMRAAGAVRVGLCPSIIGPELRGVRLEDVIAEAKAEAAAALGTHPALIQLVAERYADALERAWAALES